MLARDLGMTVGELKRRLSHEEWIHWAAFYKIEAIERDEARKK